MQKEELTKLNFTVSFQTNYHKAFSEHYIMLERLKSNLEFMRKEHLIRECDFQTCLEHISSLCL